ncbi:MAG: hypothetical protein ACHRXM_09565 [Isosphaerales bacterium]
MAEAMKVLLQGERTLDKPLAHLGFLGPDRDKMKVLDQRVEKLTEQTHTWLDYRLTVKFPELAQPVRMLFRVDAITKLPQMCRIEGHWDGKPVTVETRFDFPEKGPADIYDLGVPKTTKLVDRVPAGDLERIWESVQAGRERMDNYRAVFVELMEGIDYMWWTSNPMILYRKGGKFRVDVPCGWTGDLHAVKRPAEGEDLGKWWSERTKFFRFYPQSVVRDSTFFTSDTKDVTDRDGSKHQDIVSVHRWEVNSKPGEAFPAESSMRPEFACRPPMGLGDQHQEPMLDMHPAEGPAGCILLSMWHTTKEGRVNKKVGGFFDVIRYWLDPQRDYIVMRWDMVMLDEKGQENIIESDTIEETARSPQGVWFATKIRRKFPLRARKDKPFDFVDHIYIDFNADLPDSLFEPPTPRRIY